MPTPLWPFLTTAAGVVLGLLAEPAKAWVLRRSELKLAEREIYTELAKYIADIQRVYRGLGHDDHTDDAYAADLALSMRICKSPPRFEIIHWYRSNRLDLLLRIDSRRGVRMLSERISVLWEQANAPNARNEVLLLPERVIACLESHEKNLNGELLWKYIQAEHAGQRGDTGPHS